MTDNVQIVEKPEWISWDDIHEILWVSHEENRKKGICMRTTLLNGKELYERIRSNAQRWKTFVALDGEVVVGTCSVKIKTDNRWYAKGKVCYFMLEGIIPEYQGKGINKKFYKVCEQFAISEGCDILTFDTAEPNVLKQKIEERNGFRHVDFFSSPSMHYSVIMAKWLGKCPYSRLYCMMRYQLKKTKIKIKFKHGGKKRFCLL